MSSEVVGERFEISVCLRKKSDTSTSRPSSVRNGSNAAMHSSCRNSIGSAGPLRSARALKRLIRLLAEAVSP